MADTKVYDEYVPPGSLISYLQKALQYIELETHVRDVPIVVDCSFLGRNGNRLQRTLLAHPPPQVLRTEEGSEGLLSFSPFLMRRRSHDGRRGRIQRHCALEGVDTRRSHGQSVCDELALSLGVFLQVVAVEQ